RPHSDVLKVRNIADEIRTRGHIHSAEVLALEEVIADQWLTERLALRPGSSLFHSLILHLESGTPIQLEDRYVCATLAPDYLAQDFTTITPNVYLIRVAPLHTAEHVVRAVMPTSEIRGYLRMKAGEPCLVIRRRTWTGGRPVSVVELSHPGNAYELIGTMAE
ncbi:MAG: UTRA domain-containing protein, partial [Woeseiaceae bacterium]|nr:UTRA domain-containing protein [Woeseiaceae bacterium]